MTLNCKNVLTSKLPRQIKTLKPVFFHQHEQKKTTQNTLDVRFCSTIGVNIYVLQKRQHVQTVLGCISAATRRLWAAN